MGYLFAFLAAVGFSFKAILVKIVYAHGADAITAIALRMLFALPFFLVMSAFALKKQRYTIGKTDWLQLIFIGFFGYYLASVLDFLGLIYISASLERLLLFTYPSWLILIASVVLRRRYSARIWWALALCYSGLALAIWPDLNFATISKTEDHVLIGLGIGLVLASALSYAVHLLLIEHILLRLHPMAVTGIASSLACLFCLIHFIVHQPLSNLWHQESPVYTWTLLMAVFSTVAPIWLITEAIKRVSSSHVAIMGALGVVMTFVFAWLLLDERIDVLQILGGLLIITAVLAITLHKPSSPTHNAERATAQR